LGYEDETRYPFPGDPVDLIQSNWGPLVVDIPFADLITRYEKYLEHQRAAEVVREILEHSSGSVEPNEEDLHGAAAIYLALQEIVAEHGLDAVALKCFDLLPILKNTACFALAKLNEDGVVAACEGDIISALGMLLLRELTGQPSFLANPSTIDVEAGQISLAHCTVPRSMCSEHVVRSHFESNLGVAFQGTLHNDVYTLFRIGGPTLQDLYAAKTMYVGSGQDDKLCRTQVTLQFAQSEQALQLLRRPLGNHHLVVRGEHLGKLNSFAELILKKEPAHP
jgi:L-fucose isomerase-like protein